VRGLSRQARFQVALLWRQSTNRSPPLSGRLNYAFKNSRTRESRSGWEIYMVNTLASVIFMVVLGFAMSLVLTVGLLKAEIGSKTEYVISGIVSTTILIAALAAWHLGHLSCVWVQLAAGFCLGSWLGIYIIAMAVIVVIIIAGFFHAD
jgi:hypothetical protein